MFQEPYDPNSTAYNDPTIKPAGQTDSDRPLTPDQVEMLRGQYEYYFCSSQIFLQIGRTTVDELVGMGYNLGINIVPRFHYGDKRPRRMMHGRGMLQGELQLNYRHPMYFLLYLQEAREILRGNVSSPAPSLPAPGPERAKDVQKYIRQRSHVTQEEVIANDMSIAEQIDLQSRRSREAAMSYYQLYNEGKNPFDTGTFHDRSALKKMYWSDRSGGKSPNLTIDSFPAIDLTLKIGEPGRTHIHVIKGAKFSGPQMAWGTDGTPLAEVYPFSAKDFI